MEIDWQTLGDLGILRPEANQLSIFDWANFTQTAGGARLQKERFRRPLHDVDALRKTQDAVRWLVEETERFRPLLGGTAWNAIERYLDSRHVALRYPNQLFRWLDSWWLRHFSSDLYNDVASSLALLQMLLRHAHQLNAQLEAITLPSLIDEWRNELSLCLSGTAIDSLINGAEAHRLRPPEVLFLDNVLRQQQVERLRRFSELVYEIDVLCSLAFATRKHQLRFPVFLEGDTPRVEAEGLFHPLLDNPVGNPLRISPDERLIFLTGPNMAGKSTYLKAAGVAVYLAQLGMGVPARSFRLTPFDCLFSGINTTDNLRLGQSYFYREVRRVRDLTDILARRLTTLALFDEMFKGTNLKDASDACMAVLTGFSACDNSAFVVASHIAELAEGVDYLPGSRFLHFGAIAEDGHLVFDYRLRNGVSQQRLGMVILDREGVLAALAALARETVRE